MKPIVVTAGPFPVQYVGEVIAQLDEQNWDVRAVLFAGVVAPRVVSAESQPTPVYFCVASREPSFPGESFNNPVFKFGKDKHDEN